MTSQRGTQTALNDAIVDRVGRVIAETRREAQRERELREALFTAKLAELDARIASVLEIERRLAERLVSLKDGEPGRDAVAPTVEEVANAIRHDVTERAIAAARHEVSSWERPRDGRDFDPEKLNDAIAIAVAGIEKPRDGRDGVGVVDIAITGGNLVSTMSDGRVLDLGRVVGWDGVDIDIDVVQSQIADTIKRLWEECPKPKDGEPGPKGALPVVRQWEDRVYYQGDCVSFDGALYQAARDTGKEPGHDDWLCIVERGRDGEDGKNGATPRIRGTWSENSDYQALDIVALGGASFAARWDSPGSCPGEGWQLIAAQGKRGGSGERGKAGAAASPAASIESMEADDDGLLTLRLSNGSKIECDLYPLLSKLQS